MRTDEASPAAWRAFTLIDVAREQAEALAGQTEREEALMYM